jgi:hypothetical protein
MGPESTASNGGRLREIMLRYLEAVPTWPGGDALTVDDVLDSYPEAVARGEVPDWRQLLCRHPELDAALHSWMAAKDRWKFAVAREPSAEPKRRVHK